MEIKGRTKTASSITYQTLFKYYQKLAGMTVPLLHHLSASLWTRFKLSAHVSRDVCYISLPDIMPSPAC